MTETNGLGFAGAVAIVSGAGSGLGRAYARALGAHGARVVVNDVDAGDPAAGRPPAAEVVAREIRDAGGEAVADLSSVLEADAVIETAVAAFGTVDIVVNNAGVSTPTPFERATASDDERVMAVNVHGSLRLARAAWPYLLMSRAPSILNISSTGAFGASNVMYGTAKAAVIGLTKNLALIGRREANVIRVNAIMPQAWTPMSANSPDPALRRLMEQHFRPEQVAAFATWLCHPACQLSGEIFSVGGGRVARVVMGVTRGVVARDSGPESFTGAVDALITTEGLFLPDSGGAEFFHAIGELGLGLPETEQGPEQGPPR